MISKLALTEGEGSGEEVLLEWDRNNPERKRIAWKITIIEDIFYAVIECIDKKT